MIKYAKFKLGKYPVVSVESLAELDFRSIFTPEELELVNLAIEIQTYQLGESPLPKGMDHKQSEVFMRAQKLCQLAAKAQVWYARLEGPKKKEAICGPFLVRCKQ